MFCICLRTNSDLCHLQHKLTVFYNRDESVYCAVRTGSLKKAVCSSYLKGYNKCVVKLWAAFICLRTMFGLLQTLQWTCLFYKRQRSWNHLTVYWLLGNYIALRSRFSSQSIMQSNVRPPVWLSLTQLFRYLLEKFVLKWKEAKFTSQNWSFKILRQGVREECHLQGGDFLKAVSSTLKTGEAVYFETTESFYMTILRHIQGESNFDGDLPKKLKPHKFQPSQLYKPTVFRQ